MPDPEERPSVYQCGETLKVYFGGNYPARHERIPDEGAKFGTGSRGRFQFYTSKEMRLNGMKVSAFYPEGHRYGNPSPNTEDVLPEPSYYSHPSFRFNLLIKV